MEKWVVFTKNGKRYAVRVVIEASVDGKHIKAKAKREALRKAHTAYIGGKVAFDPLTMEADIKVLDYKPEQARPRKRVFGLF